MSRDIYQYNDIRPFKGRTLDPDVVVRVYRNLKAKEVEYSIQQNGLVVAHTSRICMKDCVFIVSEAARQRVLREKQKNVHAFIQGKITHSCMGTSADREKPLPVKISYNPYQAGHFVTSEGKEIKAAWGLKIYGKTVSGAYTNTVN